MMPQRSAFREAVVPAEDQDTSKGNCQCEIASDKCHGTRLASPERSCVPGQTVILELLNTLVEFEGVARTQITEHHSSKKIQWM